MKQETLPSGVAKVMFGFCSWVVETAREKGLRRLYFLARDGYLLREISQMICQKRGYDLSCRYLYASRLAWRLPACHLDYQEACRYVFSGALRLTFRGMMSRIRADDSQCRMCARWAGISEEQLDAPLPEEERKRIALLLENERGFRLLLEEKSREAYDPVMIYLEQEGLMNGDPVALVDSGWTGGMQHTLRQLLESAGCHSPLIGFYFGLYTTPGVPADGEYLAWCFSPRSPVRYAALFNNNVLESLCTAPHAMTVGYSVQQGWAVPEGKPPGKNRHFWQQRQSLLENCRQLADEYSPQDAPVLLAQARRWMKHLCCVPSPEEAAAIGGRLFCDDIAEGYLSPLAVPISQSQAREYLVWNRRKARPGLYWPCGSLAVSPVRHRAWYRLHIYVWEALRITRMKRRASHAVHCDHRHP